MSRSFLLRRPAALAGRSRSESISSAPQSAWSAVQQHRHPAMSGLNVSPVHGRHCICTRCARAL